MISKTDTAAMQPVAEDLSRLKARFDPLLGDAERAVAADDLHDLVMLARIHDLDEHASPSVLWQAVRAHLDALVVDLLRRSASGRDFEMAA